MTDFPSKFGNDSTGSIGLSFIRVYHAWHKQIKQELKKITLTHPQFIVLASIGYLSQKEVTVTQIAIATQAEMDVMTVSTVLKNLEKNQLITRNFSEEDTRAKIVQLTKKGRDTMEQALPIIEEIDANFFDKLGTKKTTFNQLLLKLLASDE